MIAIPGTQFLKHSFFALILICLLPTGQAKAQAQFHSFLGDSGFVAMSGIVPADDGGIVAAGYWSPEVATIRTHLYISKMNGLGDVEWAREYAGPSAENLWDIVASADGGFIVAGVIDTALMGSGDNGYVMKLDSSGNLEWMSMVGNPLDEQRLYRVHETAFGEIVGVGSYTTTVGDELFWFLRLDASGNVLQSFSYFPTSNCEGYAVQDHPDGGFVIGGIGRVHFIDEAYLFKISDTGVLEWFFSYGEFGGSEKIRDLKILADKSIVFVGENSQSPSMMFIGKVDSVGGLIFMNNYAATDNVGAHRLMEDPQGGFFVSGLTEDLNGIAGPFLMKTDANGSQVWTKIYERFLPAGQSTLFRTDTDDFILGCTYLPSQGEAFGLVIRTDPDGASCIDTAMSFTPVMSMITRDTPVVYATGAPSTMASVNLSTRLLPFSEVEICEACDSAAANFFFQSAGLDITLNNTSLNGTDFHWDFGDGNVSTDPDPVHSFASPGSYDVCLIASNLCSSDTFCQNVTIVGMNESIGQTFSLNLHPNPAQSNFRLEWGEEPGPHDILVFDMSGKQVFATTSHGSEINVDCSEWPAGLYSVSVRNRKASAVRRVVIGR